MSVGTAKRWTARRKAELITAVRTGAISIEAACEANALSIEEFQTWEARCRGRNSFALETTRTQEFR